MLFIPSLIDWLIKRHTQEERLGQSEVVVKLPAPPTSTTNWETLNRGDQSERTRVALGAMLEFLKFKDCPFFVCLFVLVLNKHPREVCPSQDN